MVQLAMLLASIVIGLRARDWRQAAIALVVVFAVSTAVQTPLVIAGDDIDSPPVYWAIQALTLAVAAGITRVIWSRRHQIAR